LVAATALNGRTLTVPRTLQVRGFPDHDTWKFLLSATCLSVDGQLRWGVEISFASSVSGSLAVERLFCNFSGPLAWTMRRSGVPDAVFTSATIGHDLAPLPALRGTWLFFVNAVGCSGGPPPFAAEFQLVCSP
jgi:hypothetical protein